MARQRSAAAQKPTFGDPSRDDYLELRRNLNARVLASPVDRAVLANALTRAADHVQLKARYHAALDAYYEFDRLPKRPRRARLVNCALAVLGHPPELSEVLAQDYEALTAPGGMRDTDSLVFALYAWRTWDNLLRRRPTEREDRHRNTPSLGRDLSLRSGCRRTDELVFPLEPLEAVAAITDAYELPSMEACNQALKRARRRGLLRAKLPNNRERM